MNQWVSQLYYRIKICCFAAGNLQNIFFTKLLVAWASLWWISNSLINSLRLTLFCPYWFIWIPMDLYGSVGLYGLVWSRMDRMVLYGPYGPVWSLMAPFGTILYMIQYGPILSSILPFSPVRSSMVLWYGMIPYGQIFCSLYFLKLSLFALNIEWHWARRTKVWWKSGPKCYYLYLWSSKKYFSHFRVSQKWSKFWPFFLHFLKLSLFALNIECHWR